MNRRNLLKSVGTGCLGITFWPLFSFKEKRSYVFETEQVVFYEKCLYIKYCNETENILFLAMSDPNSNEILDFYLKINDKWKKIKNFKETQLPMAQKLSPSKGYLCEFYYPIKIEFEV